MPDYLDYNDPLNVTVDPSDMWDPVANEKGKTLGTQVTYESGRQLVAPKNFYIDLTKRENIPLNDGWNFISFGVRKCYLTDGNAGNPLLTNAGDEDRVKVQVGDIGGVFFNIANQVKAINFWVNGIVDTVYQPGVGGNIPYLSIGYGFWINVEAAPTGNPTLVMFGSFVDPNDNDSMALNSGWTDVGYWGRDVMYTFLPTTIDFSSAQRGWAFVPSIPDIFASLYDPAAQYTMLISFDVYGPHSYYVASPGSTDFEYVGPGYGVAVNMSEPGALQWNTP
jgi:hypothetical protein